MRHIKDFENYTISPKGVIQNVRTGKVLKHHVNENGYVYASLWKNNRGSTRSIHRLVALTFIPNPNNKPFVNHIDADRSNPDSSNLEWCTQSENIKHCYNIGNRTAKRNFSTQETKWLLSKFLGNTSMTSLATDMDVGLSRMTINLRNHSIFTGQKDAFELELLRQKKVRNTHANVNKQQPIAQVCPNTGKTIKEFPSLTVACRVLGKASAGSISNALNPLMHQKTAYGFLWKYT